MRALALVALLIASPATAQLSNPSAGATPAQVQAATDAAAAAQTRADAAMTVANSAVRSVNGVSPTAGAVTLSIPALPDLSTYALKTQVPTLVSVPAAYTDAQAVAANASAIATATSSTVKTVNGITPAAGNVVLGIAGVGNVTGLAYFHRYSGVTLTVPAVGIGGTGTATATVPGTVAGDQCFVAPTAATSLLSYIMAAGWVSVAGTVKVSLAAPSVAAISATTVVVNLLCAQ